MFGRSGDGPSFTSHKYPTLMHAQHFTTEPTNLVPDLMVPPVHFSYPYPALDLDFLNQKLTIVNSTRAAKTNAVQSPSHASMACNESHYFRDVYYFPAKQRKVYGLLLVVSVYVCVSIL